jgi:hypothetical protein
MGSVAPFVVFVVVAVVLVGIHASIGTVILAAAAILGLPLLALYSGRGR